MCMQVPCINSERISWRNDMIESKRDLLFCNIITQLVKRLSSYNYVNHLTIRTINNIYMMTYVRNMLY